MVNTKYYVGDIPVGNDLYHHGIKGQKWGIRRFQNEDGSLTEAGKKRYETSEEGLAAIKRVRDAYSRHEVTGHGHARINGYDARRSLDSEQEDERGNRVKISNADDYKFFERTEKNIADKTGVREKEKAYNDAVKKYRNSFVFGRKKALNAMGKAKRELEDAGKEYTDKYLTEAVKYIDKLPKKEQEVYLDYLYQRLGWDW